MNVDGGAVALKDPKRFNEVVINSQITPNITKSFCLNDCKITMKQFTLQRTKCNGLFCDQQALADRLRNTDECGFYGMQLQKSSLALVFDLKIKNNVGDLDFIMQRFTGNHFWSLLLKEPIGRDAREIELDDTERFLKICNHIVEMI